MKPLLGRKKCLKYLVALAAFEAFMYAIKYWLQGVAHARFSRVHNITTSQIMMLFGSYLIWNRIMALVSKEATVLRDVMKAFLVIFLVSSHSVWIFFYIYLPDESWLSMFCFVCLAIFAHFAVFLFLFTIFEQVMDFLWPNVNSAVLKSRIFHTWISILITTLIVASGLSVTRSTPTVQSMDVYIPKLSPRFDGFSILLITDIHIGPTVGQRRVEQIVRLANDLQPDMVALVGDLTDGFVKYLGSRALPLANLSSKYGTFAVTGNHEYYHDEIDNWLNFFDKRLNITVLRNDNRIIRKSDGNERDAICLAGVDDVSTEKLLIKGHLMDAKKALKHCPDDIPAILLAHQPNAAKKILASTDKKISLILSGHTHGGQFYVVYPLVYLSAAYLHGLYVHTLTHTQIYVSSGVNYWGPPVKMMNLCEVVLLRLHPEKSG